MEKQDYREIVRGIKTGFEEKDYSKAIAFAREIPLRKIKEVSVLEMIADSYMKLKKPKAAKEALEIAYSRNPNGKYIVHKLAMLSIKSRDIDSAVQYYEDFCRIAPNDNQRLIIKYKIAKAGGLSNQDKIKILEEYCSEETDDKWMFELAELYHEVGDGDKCASMCDEIILWFGESDYLKKALELKFAHKSLTADQQALYEKIMHEYIGGSSEPEEEPEVVQEEDPVPTALDEEAEEFANRYLKAKGKKEFLGRTKPIDVSGKTEGRSNEIMWDIPSTVQIGAIAGSVAQAVMPELEEADKAFEAERKRQAAEKAASEEAAEEADKAAAENTVPEETVPSEETAENTEPVLSAVNMYNREYVPAVDEDYEKRMVVADDGQLELDLDLLGSEYQENHKNLSIEQMFKTYKNNIENNDSNRDAVAKVEAERLRQIQEAVANMLPGGPKLVQDDEPEEDLNSAEDQELAEDQNSEEAEAAIEPEVIEEPAEISDDENAEEDLAEAAEKPAEGSATLKMETFGEPELIEENEEPVDSDKNSANEIEIQNDETPHLEMDDDIAAQIIAKVLGTTKTEDRFDDAAPENVNKEKGTFKDTEADYDYDEDYDSSFEDNDEEENKPISSVAAGAAAVGAGIKGFFKRRRNEDDEEDFEDEYDDIIDDDLEDDGKIAGQMEIPEFVRAWKKRHSANHNKAEDEEDVSEMPEVYPESETPAENEVSEMSDSEIKAPEDATSEDIKEAVDAFKDFDEDYDEDFDNGIEDDSMNATKVIPPVVASAAAVGAGLKGLFKKHKDEDLEEDLEEEIKEDFEDDSETVAGQMEIPDFVKEWKKRHANDKQEAEEVPENKTVVSAPEKTESQTVVPELQKPEIKTVETVCVIKETSKPVENKKAEPFKMKKKVDKEDELPQTGKINIELPEFLKKSTEAKLAREQEAQKQAAAETVVPDLKKTEEEELDDLNSLSDFFAAGFVAGTLENNEEAEPETADEDEEQKDLDSLTDFFADFTAKTEEPAEETVPEEIVEETAAEPVAEEVTEPEAEIATEEIAIEEAAKEEITTEEAATEEAVTEEAVTEEAAIEEAVTEEAATEEAVIEEAQAEPAEEPEEAETAEELNDLNALEDFFADFTVKTEEPEAENATEEPAATDNADELNDLNALEDFFADFTVKTEEPAAETAPEEAAEETVTAEPVAEEEPAAETTTEEELKDLDPLADLFADLMTAKESLETQDGAETVEETAEPVSEEVPVKETAEEAADEDMDGLAGLFADFDGEKEETSENETKSEEEPKLDNESSEESEPEAAPEENEPEAAPEENEPEEVPENDETEEEYDVTQDIGTEIESEESVFVGSGEEKEYIEPEIHEGDELTIKFHDPETGEEIITSTNLDKTQPIRKIEKYALTEELREELAEFLLQEGMEENICDVVTAITALKRSGDETGGNLIVTGDPKSGKTFLAISIIKAVAQDLGNGSGKVAKVQAEAINGKDVPTIFKKIKGNDLLIENVGLLEDETIKQILSEMKSGRTNDLVVIEGNVLAVETMINNYPEIEELFKSRIDIEELTISQWADVACDYAAHKGYKMDDMALLALHAKIDQTNQPTSRFGYTDIVNIMEEAIEKSEKRNTGKLFSAFNKKEEGVIELTEADFM